MFGFALQLQSDCELQCGTPHWLQPTTVVQGNGTKEAIGKGRRRL
jgi:hypothetical protein